MPFKPSSWIEKTAPPMGGLIAGGNVADDGAMLVQGSTNFTGGPFLSEYMTNQCAVSPNQAFTWGTMPNENLEHYSSFFSIRNPSEVRYFRLRIKHGRSFFLANCTMFAGYAKLDMSTDGMVWNEVKTFYTWPQVLDDGRGGGQSQITFGLTPIFIPGSGPGGADADWLLIRLKEFSNMGVAVDKFEWYRSDDFGFTWNFVRDETSVLFGGGPAGYLTRGTQGRIVAGTNGGMSYSNDNGQTWTAVGGFLPPLVVGGVIAHLGGAFSCYQSGGLTTTPNAGVLCDGTSAQSTFGSFGGNNTNLFAIAMGKVEALALCRDSDTVPTGTRIWYSNDGGETWQLQGLETRIAPLQSAVAFGGFFPNGAPVVIAVGGGRVFVSNDRPTGNFGTRTFCPLVWAGLKKAGPPDLCGHPMLQNRC